MLWRLRSDGGDRADGFESRLPILFFGDHGRNGFGRGREGSSRRYQLLDLQCFGASDRTAAPVPTVLRVACQFSSLATTVETVSGGGAKEAPAATSFLICNALAPPIGRRRPCRRF